MTSITKILSMRMSISDRYRTKSALAEALHLSRPALHDRMSGKVEWKLSEIRMLCKLLDIPDQDKLKLLQ